MTRIDLDPKLLDRALLETDISAPIYRAYIEDQTLFIHTHNGTTTLPIKTGTVATAATPSRPPAGRSAKPNKVGPLSPPPPAGGRVAAPPAGGNSSPTPSPDVPAGSGAKAGRSAREGGIDDYTAIDGVGPKYAQDLHNAQLYTYQDLRNARDTLDDIVPSNTADQIRAWLNQRLV